VRRQCFKRLDMLRLLSFDEETYFDRDRDRDRDRGASISVVFVLGEEEHGVRGRFFGCCVNFRRSPGGGGIILVALESQLDTLEGSFSLCADRNFLFRLSFDTAACGGTVDPKKASS